MEKKEEMKIYSNYIIGIIALVLAVFSPVSGFVLGIVGLVRTGKNKDAMSKKARKLNVIAVVIGFILLAVSITLTVIGLNLQSLAA